MIVMFVRPHCNNFDLSLLACAPGHAPKYAPALTTAAKVLTRVTQPIHAHLKKNTFLGLSPDFLFSSVTGCAVMSSIEKYLQKTLALFFQLHKTTLPCVPTMTS